MINDNIVDAIFANAAAHSAPGDAKDHMRRVLFQATLVNALMWGNPKAKAICKSKRKLADLWNVCNSM